MFVVPYVLGKLVEQGTVQKAGKSWSTIYLRKSLGVWYKSTNEKMERYLNIKKIAPRMVQ